MKTIFSVELCGVGSFEEEETGEKVWVERLLVYTLHETREDALASIHRFFKIQKDVAEWKSSKYREDTWEADTQDGHTQRIKIVKKNVSTLSDYI